MPDFSHMLDIPDYSSYTWDVWLLYILFGTLGYIIRLAYSDTLISLPERVGSGYRLGTCLEWIAAVTIASLADHNILVVTAAGAGAPIIAKSVLDLIRRISNKMTGSNL